MWRFFTAAATGRACVWKNCTPSICCRSVPRSCSPLWGRGRGRLLFTWIILLGAAVAALFANDGAALILTPIVIAMLRALGFSKGTMLAFVMAAGFIADTASLPLVVSNLVNIVSADFFAIGFREYASVMVPVDLAAILTTLAMLHLFFRKDIPPAWDMALLKAPATAIKDPATFRTGWGVLLLLLAGCFVLEPLGIPVRHYSTKMCG